MRSIRGQLALGLAFMFTASLAIFSLVFQSSLVTREKMQLQQTNDFAALVAARKQRQYLDAIREANQEIEDAYKDLQTWLALHESPSFEIGCASGYVASALAVMFAAFDAKKSEGDKCAKGCGGYDSFMKGARISYYQQKEEKLFLYIAQMIQFANQDAYRDTLSVYLVPENLPIMLRKNLEKKYGRTLTLKDVRLEFEKGTLKDAYKIRQPKDDDYLFHAELEKRTFPVSHPVYVNVNYGGVDTCIPTYAYPLPTLSAAKVVRKGNFTTNYPAKVEYLPPTSDAIKELVKYNLVLRDRSQTGEVNKATDQQGNPRALLQERSVMTALSVAKPFGGTFPKAGKENQPPGGMGDRGSVGEPFKGVKLIGIADTRELGGFRLNADQVLKDKRGRTITEIFTEDFLH